MTAQRPSVDLSVIIPVGARHAAAPELYAEYKAGLQRLARSYEVIFVLDGPCAEFSQALDDLLENGESLTVIRLTRRFGEATAIMAGFEHAGGRSIMTLPAYHQVQTDDLGQLLAALDSHDVAIGRRWPRTGGAFERFRRWTFHHMLAWVTKLRFSDLGCGARAFDRQVLEEIHLYGDQYRFLPVLADRQGFRVQEVALRQSPKDRFQGIYTPGEYAQGFLDIFTVFFLARFTKRPLRFFGMLGTSTFVVGALLIIWLVVERAFFGQPLAERPALLLASLLVVLGLQIFALGLLGELIIFTHAGALKDYRVESVISFPSGIDSERSEESSIDVERVQASGS